MQRPSRDTVIVPKWTFGHRIPEEFNLFEEERAKHESMNIENLNKLSRRGW